MADQKTIKARVEQAFNNRREWESLWDKAFTFMAPERAAVFVSPRPTNSVGQEVFDSTAIDAAEGLVDIIMAGVAPEWQRWLRFKPSAAVEDEAEREELEAACQLVQDELFQRLPETNFYAELPAALLDRVVAGTGGMSYREINGRGYFSAINLKGLALEEDHVGRLSLVAVRTKWSLQDIENVYGKESVPDMVREAVQKDVTKAKLDVCEVVVREADDQWTHAVMLEKYEASYLLEETLAVSPLLASRWTRVPGTPYGRGPGLRALSDVRALNKLKELILKNAAKAVTGVYTAADDGVLNPYTVSFTPGAVIPVADNNIQSPPLMELPNTARFDVGQFEMERLMRSIERTFMADQFGDLQRTPRSALEVAERTRVLSQKLGATLNRLFHEVIKPAISLVLRELEEEGRIPSSFSLDNEALDIEFLSRLAQAQNQEEERDLLEYAGIVTEFGQVDPRAGLVLDVHKALRRVGRLKGIHPEDMRTEDQIEAMMAQAAEAAAEAEQQPEAEQNVG